MSVRAHKRAVLARVLEASRLTGKVFEGVQPGRTEAYAALYADTGFYPRDRFTGPQGGTVTYRYRFHSIGSTPDQAQAIAELVLGQLLNHRLTVPGFRVTPVEHRSSQPTQLDAQIRPPLFYCVDEYAVTSNPIPTT